MKHPILIIMTALLLLDLECTSSKIMTFPIYGSIQVCFKCGTSTKYAIKTYRMKYIDSSHGLIIPGHLFCQCSQCNYTWEESVPTKKEKNHEN
jgi:hypothetical protein